MAEYTISIEDGNHVEKIVLNTPFWVSGQQNDIALMAEQLSDVKQGDGWVALVIQGNEKEMARIEAAQKREKEEWILQRAEEIKQERGINVPSHPDS